MVQFPDGSIIGLTDNEVEAVSDEAAETPRPASTPES
jgi:hypothetical protein